MRSRRAMLAILFRHLSMVRVTATVAAALAATACAGDITGTGDDDSGDSPELAAAKASFEENVKPILDGFCGSCHVGMPLVDFMRPDPTVREHMLAWPQLIVLDGTPSESLILNKGAHTGPALTPDQSAVLLDWILLEVTAAGGEPAETVATARITPVQGINTIDLTAIDLPGSTVTFLYEPLATGMYLSDITVNAGTGGVHLVNPLFVIWESDTAPMPDPINRFGNIDLLLEEATSSYIGGGTAVFVDVPPGAPISIEFRVATLADGSGGGGGGGGGGTVGGGCNNVPSFTANAQSPLNGACASCHGGADANAVAAVDMTKIADLTPEGQAAVCGQIKTRVNDADPINSGLFLAPDPNSGTAHPFKFPTAGNFTAFRDAVTIWINAE